MKTKEELNALKNEVGALNKKLAELNEEELKQVTGGGNVGVPVWGSNPQIVGGETWWLVDQKQPTGAEVEERPVGIGLQFFD